MNNLLQMLRPLTDAWGRFNPIQKATISMMILLAVVGMVVAVGISSRPQTSILFSNLSTTDASTIVDKLKEQKVEYKVVSGGTAIEVPSKDVYDLRLKLAGEGLPKGGSVGFEIFDKSNFGMTEFTQRMSYQRALQGELERTISQLDAVSAARVHIAIPEESIYSDKDKEVTAAVFLKLKAGGALSPDQVAAITNLVSASIEGLKPNNVSITDTAGNLLSDANSGPMGITGLRQSASQLEMQKQYESQAARDLQIMLEKVLGPGKAVVRVNADLNFDAKQTESEIYEPISGNQGVLLKDEQVEESYKGGSPNSTAQPASIPAAARSANGNGEYSRTESRSQYEVSKRVEHVTEAPGKLRKSSVAHLLDGQPSPTQVNTIRQAVSVAMGIDPTRGDQVTVENLPFDTSAQKEQEKQMKSADNQNLLMNLGKWVGVIVLALLFLFFLRMFLSQMKPVEVTESYSEPLTLKEAEQMLELRSDEEAAPRQVTGRRAAELAKENPSEVAKLVRNWLQESEQQ